MLLERRTISRKTARDGKVEITKAAAGRLARHEAGSSFPIDVGGHAGVATVGTFECTCRGPEHVHVHYFLESELLKGLEPDSRVDLELDADAHRLAVRPVAPG